MPKKVISLESSNYSELIAHKMIALWTFVLAGTSQAFLVQSWPIVLTSLIATTIAVDLGFA